MRSLTAVVVMLLPGITSCRAPAPPPPPEAPADVAAEALLLAATRIALPPAGVSAADLPDATSPGARALVRYCAQCHALPAPAMHSATDWPGVVRRMWLRMDWLPSGLEVQVPTEGDRAVMLTYLTTHALQVSGATLPPGPGRDDFVRVCSRCHALPNPLVHAPQDWLTVYMRMEGNMERMSVPPATQEEGSRILSYLQAERDVR